MDSLGGSYRTMSDIMELICKPLKIKLFFYYVLTALMYGY